MRSRKETQLRRIAEIEGCSFRIAVVVSAIADYGHRIRGALALPEGVLTKTRSSTLTDRPEYRDEWHPHAARKSCGYRAHRAKGMNLLAIDLDGMCVSAWTICRRWKSADVKPGTAGHDSTIAGSGNAMPVAWLEVPALGHPGSWSTT